MEYIIIIAITLIAIYYVLYIRKYVPQMTREESNALIYSMERLRSERKEIIDNIDQAMLDNEIDKADEYIKQYEVVAKLPPDYYSKEYKS